MPHIHSIIQPTLDTQLLFDSDTDDANDIDDLDYLYGELFENLNKERWEHSRINWSLHIILWGMLRILFSRHFSYRLLEASETTSIMMLSISI